MRSRRAFRTALLCLAPLLILGARSERAAAAGYGIYEQGAAVLGMAGAGTASVNDASAVFYNPAVMTGFEQHLFYAGGAWLVTNNSFAGFNPYPGFGVIEEMERGNFILPTVYYAGPLNDDWAIGAGFNTPFGLGVEWKNPDQFSGRYIVTKADLRTVNAGASLAYAFSEQVSVAAGANALFSTVKLQNNILQPLPGGGGAQFDAAHVTLRTDVEPGYGWNAAASVVPNENWKFGAYYRSKVIAKPGGDATFAQIFTGDPATDAAVATGLPPDQRGSAVLRFPAIWSAGVAWIDPGRWTIAADAVFTEWSVFTDLPVFFEQTPSANLTIEENYDDTFAFRIGGEFRTGSNAYRLGYYFEQEAAPVESVSPLLPDAARNALAVGLGFDFGASNQWTLDLYNLALFVARRDTENVNRDGFDGEYKSFVNAFGAAITYRR